MHKIPAPYLVGSFGSLPHCRRHSPPFGAALLLAYLQAFLSPYSLHPSRVYLSSFAPEQRGDSAIDVSRLLFAKHENSPLHLSPSSLLLALPLHDTQCHA